MGKRLIVIGGTAAGLSAASKAKRSNPDLEIVVYEKTGYVSYGACGLPYFVGDKIKEAEELISISSDQLKSKRDIAAHTEHEVLRIDRENKKVEVLNRITGERFFETYDFLVIATGGAPIIPAFARNGLSGVYTLRTVEDGIALKRAVCEGARHAVIIGGGFIGLEMAEELTEAGVKVSLIEALPRLLPFLPDDYSNLLLETLHRNGVDVLLGDSVEEILATNGSATGIKLSSGKIVEADMILLSIGSAPNTTLAKESGLKLGIRGTIVVDEHQRTSDPDIWACGDCVEMVHLLTKSPCYVPLGTTANKQGRIAGGSIVGEQETFKGVLGSQVTKVFDLFIASTGFSLEQAKDAGWDVTSSSIVKGDKASYYPGSEDNQITLVFESKGGRIVGAQAIGSSSVAGRMNVLVAAITMGMTVLELNELDLVYSPSVAPVYDPLLIAASQAIKRVH